MGTDSTSLYLLILIQQIMIHENYVLLIVVIWFSIVNIMGYRLS